MIGRQSQSVEQSPLAPQPPSTPNGISPPHSDPGLYTHGHQTGFLIDQFAFRYPCQPSYIFIFFTFLPQSHNRSYIDLIHYNINDPNLLKWYQAERKGGVSIFMGVCSFFDPRTKRISISKRRSYFENVLALKKLSNKKNTKPNYFHLFRKHFIFQLTSING